jgi:hypothetical protein
MGTCSFVPTLVPNSANVSSRIHAGGSRLRSEWDRGCRHDRGSCQHRLTASRDRDSVAVECSVSDLLASVPRRKDSNRPTSGPEVGLLLVSADIRIGFAQSAENR